MPVHHLSKPGRHYRYEPPSRRKQGAIEFWAEGGMVCFVDERFEAYDDKHFEILTVREFLQNFRSLNASIPLVDYNTRVSTAAEGGNSTAVAAEERDCLQRMVSDGIDCAKRGTATRRSNQFSAHG